MNETVLKRYIRNPKTNAPIGVAVAVKGDNQVYYGFSLLNTLRDKWDKKMGLAIALARSSATQYKLPDVPERTSLVLDAYAQLEERATKYFQDIDPANIAIKKSLSQEPYEL